MTRATRQRLVRPELHVRRLFNWFDQNGEYVLPEDFAARLEDVVIGRAQSEEVSTWKTPCKCLLCTKKAH